jgi:hypothetical protein
MIEYRFSAFSQFSRKYRVLKYSYDAVIISLADCNIATHRVSYFCNITALLPYITLKQISREINLQNNSESTDYSTSLNMNLTAMRFLTLSVILATSVAFMTTNRNFVSLRQTGVTDNMSQQSSLLLMAKKLKTESKGFSPKKVKVVKEEDDEEVSEGQESTSIIGTNTSAMQKTQSFDGETDADAIFKKYGIKDGETNKSSSGTKKKKKTVKKGKKGEPEENPFGQSVLANIPAETQLKIDNTLVSLVATSLGFVILSGISISLGAYTVVFPETKIPEWLDGLVTNFLSPAFTPALAIFFFFSTTFGLFKFAQISSDQTVYKEEVTRDL